MKNPPLPKFRIVLCNARGRRLLVITHASSLLEARSVVAREQKHRKANLVLLEVRSSPNGDEWERYE